VLKTGGIMLIDDMAERVVAITKISLEACM
jgi:hypothetical protein